MYYRKREYKFNGFMSTTIYAYFSMFYKVYYTCFFYINIHLFIPSPQMKHLLPTSYQYLGY